MEKQRWKESMKRRAKQKRSEKRKSEKKEDAGARKGRNTVFFQWFCGSGGSKSRLAKAADTDPCGHMRDEKLCAAVAQSKFPSQNVQSTRTSDHFWKLRCRKSARRCGAKHFSKSKCSPDHMLGPLWRFRCGFAWQARGILHLAEREQTWGFCGISKNDGRRGAFEEDLQRCMSRGRRSTKHMCIRDVRRSGRWFPEKGCILEHQIFRFAKMILRDWQAQHFVWPGFTFSWQAQYFRQMEWKIAKRSGTRPSAPHATSHFWRKSRGIASFLMLEKWGSLAELLRFWCCQLQKSRKSRRIASFLTLPSSKVEDVSQNSFGFKLAYRQIDSYNYNILQLHYATQPNTTLPYSYSHSHD